MRIYVLSDLHLEFASFDPPKLDADVIILAGDIHVKHNGVLWALEKFPDKPVIYVLGNHEYYQCHLSRQLQKLKQEAEGSNVHILENDSVTLENTTFLGCTLWTDFKLLGNVSAASFEANQCMNDYRYIRINNNYRRLKAADTASMHAQSLSWLRAAIAAQQQEKLVIISHHAPSVRSIPQQYQGDSLSAAYASNLDDFVLQSGAKLWVHGHIHNHNDYMIGTTRVISNPRGYPKEKDVGFSSDWVIEI